MRERAKDFAVILVACVAFVSGPAAARAARCSGIDPNRIVFCDDFDRWCDPEPAPGGACAVGATTDTSGFLDFWPQQGTCSSNTLYNLNQSLMWKPTGYALFVPQNSNIFRLVSHGHDMTNEILVAPANPGGQNAVNGTSTILSSRAPGYVDPATMPGVLKGQFFVHQATPSTAFANMTYYTELHLGEDRAPINFTRVNCYDVNEEAGLWQRIVTTDGNEHASFAFGIIAIFDSNPCDSDAGGRRPAHYRAVVYDGMQWQVLQHPAFDLPNGNEDFRMSVFRPGQDPWNRYYFYIGSDAIEIRAYCAEASYRFSQGLIDQDYYVARVARQYRGPFNRVAMGADQGVDQSVPDCRQTTSGMRCIGGIRNGQTCATASECPASTGECVASTCAGGSNHGNACTTNDDCPDAEECIESLSGNGATMEELVLYDGVFQNADFSGACCLPDTTCTETIEADCLSQNGEYHGDFTSCADVLCCPTPFADADIDSDLDQKDFAAFQRCLTAAGQPILPGCECFDRNDAQSSGQPDGSVTTDDFPDFLNCVTGPDIPFDLQNPPAGCTP